METIVSAPVTITDSAVHQIKKIMSDDAFNSAHALRVGVKGGGCSGMTYILGFDDRKESDEEFVIDGITCIINKAHGIYLTGMEIDWQDGLNSRGFTFSNPNASKTCGCGTSFAV